MIRLLLLMLASSLFAACSQAETTHALPERSAPSVTKKPEHSRGDAPRSAAPQCTQIDAISKSVQVDASQIPLALSLLECESTEGIEDLNRALGVAFARSPGRFLADLDASKIDSRLVPNLFIMLPIEFVDRPCQAKAEYMHRLEILRARHDVQWITSVAIPELEKAVTRKRSACASGD